MAPAHSAKPLGKWTVPSSRGMTRGRRCTFLARSGVHSLLSIDSERVWCVRGVLNILQQHSTQTLACFWRFTATSFSVESGCNVLRPPVAKSSKSAGAVFDPHGESKPLCHPLGVETGSRREVIVYVQ